MNKFKVFLALTLIFLINVLMYAQTKFDFDNPAGTYVITDYLGKKITLKLQPGQPGGVLMVKGKGTVTINGRTISGSWHRFDNDRNIMFETYDNVTISYNLPDGSAKVSQIVMTDDGRASYNLVQILDHKNYINVKRVPDKTSKKATTKNQTVSPVKSSIINLTDFISSDKAIELDFNAFKNKGFTISSNDETGAYIIKKGGITIEYFEDFDDDGEGSKYVEITFQDMEDAYNFISPLKKHKDWIMSPASLGEFFEMRRGNITVYREIAVVQISDSLSD